MIILIVALLGVALGSFVNALVWRVYIREEHTKSKGAHKSHRNISIWKGRSMCPECRHELAAKDLIPIASWLMLKGKCRYCNKPISKQYPLVELLSGVLFITTYLFWSYPLTSITHCLLLSTFYILLTTGLSLAIYDLKWMTLPTKLVYVFNGVSMVFLALLSLEESSRSILVSGLIGAVLYSGFFYLLYILSSGKWIGGGDVRLAVGLGLLLGWQKSIVSLSMAAYLGTFVVIGLVFLKKYHKKMKMPFGPFLLIAAYSTFFWGQALIDWYLGLSGL